MLHSTCQRVWWYQMRAKETIHQRTGQCDKVANILFKACDDKDGTSCTLAECRAFCEVHPEFKCSYYSFEAADGDCYLFDGCKNLNTRKITYMSYHLDGGGANHDMLNGTATDFVDLSQLPRCHAWKDNTAWTEYGIGSSIISNLARL